MVDLVLKEDSVKGWGVFTKAFIPKNSFVIEYKGDLIEKKEAEERERIYSNQKPDPGCYMFYFKTKTGKNMCIDATAPKFEFGYARYVNHSKKNKNLCGKLMYYLNEEQVETPKLMFYALRDININTELLIDYGDRSKKSTDSFPWLKQ